jgi:hypothetical protein
MVIPEMHDLLGQELASGRLADVSTSISPSLFADWRLS